VRIFGNRLNMDNRQQLLDLIAKSGITQLEAAKLIGEYTRRPCALRSVQAWLNDPTKSSSRRCPDWAVDALRAKLKIKKPAAATS
jgi:hypothetical protein